MRAGMSPNFSGSASVNPGFMRERFETGNYEQVMSGNYDRMNRDEIPRKSIADSRLQPNRLHRENLLINHS